MSNNVSFVARYMIKFAEESSRPISNLKLQKLLYFLWKKYFKEKGEPLFEDDCFFAWKFGPVVPSVYYEYFMFGAYPIASGLLDDFDENSLCKEDKAFISDLVKQYEDKKVGQLIDLTHKPGGAWDRIFDGGQGFKELIPYREIVRDIYEGR